MTPLYPYFSQNFLKTQEVPTNFYFLNSGRSSLELIVQDIKNSYEHLIFLIPAYTCTSVVFALISQEVEFDFVDLDESLDFNLDDLDGMVEKYKEKNIVLIPTSLYGCDIRNYKDVYQDLTIIEDRAQGRIDYESKADYQFVSFGKGKLVSAWNGGAVYTKKKSFQKLYNVQKTAHGFLYSYLMANIQKCITKYFYLIIEKSPLNPESEDEPVYKENYIYKPSKTKIKWILNSLESLDLQKRSQNTKSYRERVAKNLQFETGGENMLRFPVKKRVKYSGVSYMSDYKFTYETALKKRDKEMDVPRLLAYNCTFLPTHDLVSEKYVSSVIELINE